MRSTTTLVVAAIALTASAATQAEISAFSAAGDAASIQATVDAFRATLGELARAGVGRGVEGAGGVDEALGDRRPDRLVGRVVESRVA